MKTISLSGSSWTFAARGAAALAAGEPMPAAVPGCNYHDLLRLGLIEDPDYADNEAKCFWVAEADFDYFRTFTLEAADLAADRVELSCAMLDTLCRVYVNDVLVGEGRNTHIGYAFDVTRAVHVGENALRVEFDSPVRYARAMAKQFTTAKDMQFTGRTHIRKAQCHFGWDFWPCLPISGITGEIALKLYTGARLLPMEISQRHEAGQVTLRVTAHMEEFQVGVRQHVTLLSPEGEALAQGENGLETRIENPRLWWTHDLSDEAEQPLYTVRVEALVGETCVDTMESRVGLRTLELNREADEYGHNFQFVLNGVPLFAKGANWVPTEVLPGRAAARTRRDLLEQCVRANMNMLRVWGGGFYEPDEFYDICDSMGLLVWQDFSFACAPYPFDRPDFLQNVKDEVVYNVTRLRHHASLALWCGNNELESMAVMWMRYRKLHQGTGKFFWETLPGWVRALDPGTPFTATSPTGGAFMRGPESDGEGDTHLWHVWHGLQPIRYYGRRMTRFCSEFGLQSLPSMAAVRSFAGEGALKLNSPAFKLHQKCMLGNEKLLYYALSRYRLPKVSGEPSDFAETLYLTQLTQADYVAYATEHWRRHRGRCNGSLYWQLNDSWPAPTWSSVDNTGRAKALLYYARRFNASVSLSIDDDGRIYVLNDTTQSRSLTLTQQLMDFDGQAVLSQECPAGVPPLCAAEIADALHRKGGRDLVLRVQLKDGTRVLSERALLFGKEKDIALPRCEFTSEAEVRQDIAYITVRSDKFARAVFIESDLLPGNCSDNFVDLFPGEAVTFTADANGADAGAIRDSLRFTCVNNLDTHARARSALKRLGLWANPTHLGSWLIFKMRRKIP